MNTGLDASGRVLEDGSDDETQWTTIAGAGIELDATTGVAIVKKKNKKRGSMKKSHQEIQMEKLVEQASNYKLLTVSSFVPVCSYGSNT